MQGRCHVWPRLGEFSGVVLHSFTLCRSSGFTDVSLIKPENSFNQLFKVILYSCPIGQKSCGILSKALYICRFGRSDFKLRSISEGADTRAVSAVWLRRIVRTLVSNG